VEVAESFDELYDLHATRALRLAVLLVGDRDVAEDLVADAFARVLPHWRRGSVLDFGPYLRTAVVNAFRARIRRDAREHDLAVPPAPADDDLAELIADRAALGAALRRLPDRQRAAIVLRYYEDLSERDVAELLGCPLGTAKASIWRGLARLRTLLQEDTTHA
jgi:RNA polymerase sigma-70 factor (sigma-E family)